MQQNVITLWSALPKSTLVRFLSGGRGTSSTYELRRLKRDGPDLYAKVEISESLSAGAPFLCFVQVGLVSLFMIARRTLGADIRKPYKTRGLHMRQRRAAGVGKSRLDFPFLGVLLEIAFRE